MRPVSRTLRKGAGGFKPMPLQGVRFPALMRAAPFRDSPHPVSFGGEEAAYWRSSPAPAVLVRVLR